MYRHADSYPSVIYKTQCIKMVLKIARTEGEVGYRKWTLWEELILYSDDNHI